MMAELRLASGDRDHKRCEAWQIFSLLKKKDVLDSVSWLRILRNSRTFLVLCQSSQQLLLLATSRIMVVMSGIPGCPCMAGYCSHLYYPKYTVFSFFIILPSLRFVFFSRILSIMYIVYLNFLLVAMLLTGL